LTLCRYWGNGINQTPKTQARAGELERELRLRQVSVVRRIGTEFNQQIRLTRQGATTCPEDEGARLYAIFGYPDEPTVPVEIDLSGCRFAGNGRTAVAMGPHLLHALEGLTRPGA
jgi:hypothetical protein